MALYDPDEGFFTNGGAAGRTGHFLTSPEVGPLFAAVLARAVDRWWEELDRPDPFVVVEAGAGAGSLARDLLAARPACGPALRYVLVERSERLRSSQRASVVIEPPAGVLGWGSGDDGDDDRGGGWSGPPVGIGPVATSLPDLPAGPLSGVVVANELLDNLPFLLLERRRPTWMEIRVGAGPEGLVEVAVPAAAELAAEAERLAPDAPDGGRIPLQQGARAWLRRAFGLLERGRVAVIDYADTTASLARRPWLDWVRTYHGHSRAGHPLERPGSQDITCEVAVDQLAGVRPLTANRSQAEFLVAHGIDELADAARAGWAAGAAAGSLDAVRAKSRVTEAAALLDPSGLGSFRALEWVVG